MSRIPDTDIDSDSKDYINYQQKHYFTSVKSAYEDEVNMFIHVHLRNYDRHGLGDNQDHEYTDRFGAPIHYLNSWAEGYCMVEDALIKHNDNCSNRFTPFPLVGCYSGAAHLYKNYHDDEPWNRTGWITKQRKHIYNSTTNSGERVEFLNRFFLCLRGKNTVIYILLIFSQLTPAEV